MKNNTYWVHHSPRRSCFPAHFVWTEWPWRHSDCPTETARNEGGREGDTSAGHDDGSSKKRWTSAAGLNSQTLSREELFFFSLGSLGEKLRQRKYEYENEAAAPWHADTSRALPLMSASSNKRHPTLRCTCLTTSHMWQLEVGEEEWED